MRPIRWLAAHSLAVAVSLPVLAQNPDGPYWNELPLPSNTLSVRALGSLVIVETPTDVHLYSGLLRTWTVQPISPQAVVNATNRYCVIQDGNAVHAWSAATGVVATVALSGPSAVYTGSLSSSWVVCVQDGNVVRGYSAFLGQWVTLPTQAAANTISLGSHSILVVTSTTAYAFSAFFGQWVAEPIRLPGVFQAFRSGALAQLSGPDEVKAFSSYQNTWKTSAMPGATAAALDAQDGYAVLQQGSEVAFCSTMTGNIVRRTLSGIGNVQAARNVAVFDDGGTLYGYAPGTDAVVALPAPGGSSQPALAPGSVGSYAIIDDGSQLHAFCGLDGRMTTSPVGSFTVTLGGTAAYADNALGTSYAYSALTGAWVAAPSVNVQVVTPTFESVILTTPTTFEAFSARTGAWSSLVSQGYLVDQTTKGAMAAAVATNRIDVYDPVLGRWVGQPTVAAANLSIWRLTGVAEDGTNAYGYSYFHHTWEAIALQGTVANFRANSSIGYVETSSHVYSFTGNGSLSNHSRFPEFSRFCTRGGEILHMQVGPAGAGVLGLFGTDATEIPLGAHGTLWLDPTTAAQVPLGMIPADGVLFTHIAVPLDPSLTGAVLNMQDIIVPAVGQPWLTNYSSPYIW